MYDFDIFADSSANIPDELIARHGIRVIPYSLIANGVERQSLDGSVPFQELAKRFYEELRAGVDIKTSLVSKETFKSAVRPSLEAGRDALIVTITEGLSGTNAQANRAREELLEEFPDRKIFVADSANASLGQGLLVLGAARLRAQGEPVEACAAWVTENRYSLNSVVTVGELKYLHRSGRVSGVLAFAGTLLNIKPMLKADGSSPAKLVIYGKEKGRKKALAEMVRMFETCVESPEAQTIAIAHADCEEDALTLKAALEERGAKDVIIEYYDLCTGSHVGPGTLALFFFGKDRRENAVPEKKPLFAKWRAARQEVK